MASADETRGKELAELARQFFLWLQDHELDGLPGLKGLPPSAFKMNAGVYRAIERKTLSDPGKVIQFWDDPVEQRRLRAVNLGARHVLLFAKPMEEILIGSSYFDVNEVYFTGDGDLSKEGALGVMAPELDSATADATTMESWVYLTFAGLIGRVDLVWDDAAEAERVAFRKRYRWVFDYEAPRRAYDANVRDIIPLADDERLTDFREHLYWYATYANRELVQEEGGDYYRKWKAEEPRSSAQRQFLPTKLSTRYLKECFHELVLQKHQSYLLLQVPGVLFVYRLVSIPGKAGKPPKLSVKLVLKFQNLQYLGASQKLEIPDPIQAVIFYALDGNRNLPAQLKDRGHAELGGTPSGRYAYDYKAAVRWYYSDRHIDPGDDEAWFNLFVNTLFADSVYPVNGKLQGAASSALTLDELLAQASDATGPIKDSLDAMREAAEREPHLRFLVKGWEYGTSQASRRQLIGVSNGHVFEWFPRTGLVTRMELSAWFRENEIGKLVAEVYENTRGMIPFMMVVSWAGVVVAAAPIIGGAALANLARTAIRDLAKEYAVKRVTKQLLKKFRAQLIALIVDALLGLMPRTDSVLFELLRGFIHGFGAGAAEHYLTTIDDRFEKQAQRLYKKAISKLSLGVDKVYQVYQKINAALTKLQAVFAGLQAIWSPQLADAAAAALVLVGRDLAIGLIVTVFVLAYVDYLTKHGTVDQAKRDAWARSQRDALKFMIKETGADLAAYAEAVREDLSGSTGSTPSADLVRERNDRLALSIASAVMKAPTDAPGVMAILDEILKELGIENWSELLELGFLELVTQGLDSVRTKHPDLEARGARVLGEALGELIGTIFLERAMLPKKWREAKITGSRQVDKSIRKVLAGGTAAALWRFVKVPLDELRTSIKTVVDSVQELPTDSPGVFDRVQRDETGYHELLSGLLKQERELATSTGKLAMDETLPDRLRALVELVATEAPPDIESVLDTTAADDPRWPRDAMLFVLETWFRIALVQLLRAFDRLEDDQPFDGKFKLATLLEIAGLEVGLDDKVAAQLAVKFAREF